MRNNPKQTQKPVAVNAVQNERQKKVPVEN